MIPFAGSSPAPILDFPADPAFYVLLALVVLALCCSGFADRGPKAPS